MEATAAVPRGAGLAGRGWAALGATGGAVLALVVLVIANALFTPNFASVGNFWNILFQLAVTLLVAVGMTLVIATGGIDLSVGSVMAIAAAVAAVTLDSGLLVAIPAALLAAMAVGLLNGAFVSYFKVQAIVVTLATLLAGRGLAQVINRDGALIAINDPGFLSLGRGHLGPVPVQVLIAAVVVGLAVFVLRSTPFGRYVLAAGGNPAAARLAGVPVNRTVVSVYVISGLLAGMAGLIEASRLGASAAAKIGQNVELDAIAAVVVGGTLLSGGRATIMGTVVGALIMQVIATSFNMLLVPYAWALAFKALIIFFAVYLQRPRRV
ncbi:MAG TPA: ABC transporter permease [Longimicrobium sp.]|jgi:ribose/xylose/arabinose/galactoside ABC-type transport system permease subunit|uniref:ABC transporter permease n=1 Tax=Longimicrobium sp. TaxID=2029185 RepID=UPI002EDBABE9